MRNLGRPASLFVIGIALSLHAGPQHVLADEVVQPSPFSQMLSNLNPANWKMPNFRRMLPQKDEQEIIKKKKESLVDEVGKTASNSWTRTKEVLDPQKLVPSNFFTTSAKSPAKPAPTVEKPGFFKSMFAPSVPPDENDTVSGFLKQSRPAP